MSAASETGRKEVRQEDIDDVLGRVLSSLQTGFGIKPEDMERVRGIPINLTDSVSHFSEDKDYHTTPFRLNINERAGSSLAVQLAAELGHAITHTIVGKKVHIGIDEAYDFASGYITASAFNIPIDGNQFVHDVEFGKTYMEELRNGRSGWIFGGARPEEMLDRVRKRFLKYFIEEDRKVRSVDGKGIFYLHRIIIDDACEYFRWHGAPGHQIGSYLLEELVNTFRDSYAAIMGDALYNKKISKKDPVKFLEQIKKLHGNA